MSDTNCHESTIEARSPQSNEEVFSSNDEDWYCLEAFEALLDNDDLPEFVYVGKAVYPHPETFLPPAQHIIELIQDNVWSAFGERYLDDPNDTETLRVALNRWAAFHAPLPTFFDVIETHKLTFYRFREKYDPEFIDC